MAAQKGSRATRGHMTSVNARQWGFLLSPPTHELGVSPWGEEQGPALEMFSTQLLLDCFCDLAAHSFSWLAPKAKSHPHSD